VIAHGRNRRRRPCAQGPDAATTHVVASATVAAFLPIDAGEWRLCPPSGGV